MSSNIIPMLPSTPPPLDESVESDDDELGNFTTALGKYDDSLAEVPRSACDESQTKTEKNNCTNYYVQSRNDLNIQRTEIHLGNSYKHFSEFPEKSVVKEKNSDDNDRKINRKSSSESIRNGKVERIAPGMQEKLHTDDSGRYSPILNDTESLNDSSLKIKQELQNDSVCLAEDGHHLLATPSVEGDISDGEISITQENRTAVSFASDGEDATALHVTKQTVNDMDTGTVEERETERICVSSQQYKINSEDPPSTFILPLVPKPTETNSFQHKSNVDSLEPSPISASENFTSVSDVSSEFSNFETAKSSPNSTDTCDKQEMIDRSESDSICTQEKKKSEHEIKDSVDENSCSSVSPLVFQENIPMESEVDDDDDDDDDFADFQQANDDIPSATVTKGEGNEFSVPDLSDATAEPNADFDDFADFAHVAVDNDDFADFESAPEASWSHTEDHFADFEQVSFENGTQKVQTEEHTGLTEIPDKGKGKVTQLVNASFPITYEEKTLETDEVFPFKNETDYTSMLLRGRSKRLWDRLQDLDTTPAMLFRWGSSQCFQAMLHALNIDSHSILRNPSVPIFASSLGLLEPTKGPQSPKPHAIVNKHISFQEVVPPAQFDWSDSGLINPLDTPQASSLFDLDFFMAQSTVPSTTDMAGSELEAELFGPSTVHVSSGDKDSKSPLITQILASTKSTIFPSTQRQCSRPAGLSEEVVRVLDKLPDLSFMQAKVLMFPIHDISDH